MEIFENNIKYKRLFKILSILAFVSAILAILTFGFDYIDMLSTMSKTKYDSLNSITFLGVSKLISFALYLPPFISLLLFSGSLYKKAKGHICIILVFALMLLMNVFYLIDGGVYNGLQSYVIFNWEQFYFRIILILIFIGAIFKLLVGKSNNFFVNSIISINLMLDIIKLLSYTKYGIRDFAISEYCVVIANILFYLALLLFFENNTIPALFPKLSNIKNLFSSKEKTPAEKLQELNNQLSAGKISKVEYDIKRNDVLNKL